MSEKEIHMYGLLVVLVVSAIASLFASKISRDKKITELKDNKNNKDTKFKIDPLLQSDLRPGKTIATKPDEIGNIIALLVEIGFFTLFSYLTYEAMDNNPLHWWISIISGGSMIWMAFMIFQTIPSIRKSELVLNIHGFETPLYGTIPWRYVSGVKFKFYYGGRYGTIEMKKLILQIEDYSKVAMNVHWTVRLLGFFGFGALKKGVVVADLTSDDKEPEVLAASANFLWQKSTGRKLTAIEHETL